MAIIISVNGNSSGEGFLIAPVGTTTFAVPVTLHTDDGSTVHATLAIVPGGAGVAFSATSVTITPGGETVQIHATSASHKRDDTVLEVKVGGVVKASFKLTAITNVQLRFQGRFQARFATDGDFYNNARGTSTGWNFALEGEPDFVPADSVATSITKPVGRTVVFNNPAVPVRTHVPAVGVHVSSILGAAGSKTEEFTAGDPIIKKSVNLGPNTYLAANEPSNTPTDPAPAETYAPGFEPMAIFEFHIPGVLSGKPLTAADRPFATGLFALTAAEISQYGIVPQSTFDASRKTALLADYHALSPADRTGTAAGRNLATRIAHLGGDAASGIAPLGGTLPIGYSGKEQYTGLINDALTFVVPESVVVSYLHAFKAWVFVAKLFNYHSDEQCGRVDGHVSVKQPTGKLAADLHEVVRETPTDSGPPLPRSF